MFSAVSLDPVMIFSSKCKVERRAGNKGKQVQSRQ